MSCAEFFSSETPKSLQAITHELFIDRARSKVGAAGAINSNQDFYALQNHIRSEI